MSRFFSTGVSPVQFAEAERSNFKSRTTIQADGVELQLSLMDMDGRFTNEQKLERARKAMTAQAQRKLDMIGKISKALGMDVVVHDYMRGSNGYFGEDGKIHFVLSGHMSVARVAAHELTHQMQSVASEKYTVVRDQLIEDVGQDRFDRLLKRKAAQYGYNMESEQGRLACDEEVIAELCEGMLSDKDRLERFAERHTDTALTLKERLTKILNAIHATLKDTFGQNQNRISDMITDEKTADKWLDGLDEVLKKVQERKSTLEGAIGETANVTSVDQDNLVEELKEAKTERQVDEKINKYCVDITRSDLAGYRQDLLDSGLVGEGKPISQYALNGLFNLMTKVCDKVSMHRAILDFGPELKTEAEISAAKENRAYVPYKQNADPHYKLALDFSTLCRKRILLQTIAERLQAKMGRAVTQEETVAIRLELQKLQQEGMKIEVACALCYVEAARLKSPKAINAFLNNPEAYMRKYLAQKVGTAKEQVAEQQRKWKEEHGYHPNETKSNMSAADEKAYNDFSKLLRESLSMDEESERIIARAVDVVRNTPEKLLSAKGIEQLKKSLDAADRTLVDAFVTQVRNATRSKAQETDTPYVRGDAKRLVPDSVIQYANQESGFRHQSWSDFQVIHMLDTMAAVIELAQRRAKMHAYTKVPAMVEMCGNTGMMINMSLIPHGNTGLDVNGNLSFDRVEGMPWDTMMDLRDRFPDTAGNIAIGINDAQIRALLASEDIDYVIPYHASGMNKNMRKYLDIRSWTEYTSTQNERGNNRGKKGDAPALAEWFNEAEAVKAKDGNAYMREASEKYLQLCYERNLIPKFSQYLVKGEDGRYSLSPEYENYWKMLVDRKMVNQKTGKVIQQKPVLPVFDDATIMNILDDRLADPSVQDAEKAADIVTSRFADWTKGRNNASAEAIEEAKRIRDRSAALTVQKTVGSNGTRYALDTDHYDYSRSFAQQIDDYVAGKFPRNDTFVLGKTPDIFQKVGLSALPMTMDQVHVDYALNGTKDADHLMGADLLKELPSLLEKPVAIIESATHPDSSVVAIVEGEVNGKQLMAAVRVGGRGKQNGATIDSNHVASSHGKGNAITKLLLDALKKENAGETGVYYINKTEAQDLCARTGVQFPGTAAQDGLIHSIFDAGSPVNRKYMEQTETRQFKRWFGNSKVVDKKGAPRKLYHYTDGEFTVFDTGKSGSNQGMRLGDGIYLSTSPTEFSSYGENR